MGVVTILTGHLLPQRPTPSQPLTKQISGAFHAGRPMYKHQGGPSLGSYCVWRSPAICA